ncbi:oxygen-independent coproporphyrinogen III oxidase [Methylocella sp.]|uniref:oxygen-independent coproporphyrinogen III oxidase n=1 Tax=Methylocella sp. TaxID=1978226 RepID=UPI003784654F
MSHESDGHKAAEDEAADPILVSRYAAALPRYTSYPTANHFHAGVDQAHMRAWLGALDRAQPVSAYLHVPFCRDLCWYCGCSTKATRRYAPVSDYVDTLEAELASVAEALGFRPRLAHLHFGGGSPDILTPADVERLVGALAMTFDFEPDMEFAVEIDPRLLTGPGVRAFSRAGVTRVSLGVQDFDLAVQEAIGRLQSFDETRSAVEAFRAAGAASVNLDLVYGLPRQTLASLSSTLDRALSLAPDRIALFGYAHLPQKLPQQRLVDEAALPGPAERFAQARLAEDRLAAAGYVRLGIDHFARPEDSLATSRLSRNFQGYTADGCETLIGLGASAISRFPQGYVQNAAAVGVYKTFVEADGLGAGRGFELSSEDRMRAFVIERLMCDFAFPGRELRARFGAAADALVAQAGALLAADDERFLAPTPQGFRLTARGRPFVRHIAARFDAYLEQGAAAGAKHSLAV